MKRDAGWVWIWTAFSALTLVVLSSSLPPHGFYSGDSGVKLIAADNAIAHPGRPFDIDLPRIAGRPTTYVERFFEVHGEHAHALQSALFPLLSAPFIALLGVRGAYVLPAIGFLALVPLLFALRDQYAADVPAWLIGLIAVGANPLFFYALEYWEHVPAAALVAAATALVSRRPAAAGACAGVAVLLRPEALWYAAGLMLATNPRRWRWFVIGGAVSVAPLAIYNFAHSGNPIGPHAAANLAPLADAWASARIERVRLWLSPGSAFAWIGIAAIAASHLARLARLDVRACQTIALCGAALIGFAAADGQMNSENLWRVWPLGVLLLIPGLNPRTRLWIPAGVVLVGVMLLSTHDGGAQWGPRFLLIASPALIILACLAAHQAIGRDGAWFAARAVLVGGVVFASIFVNRDAYRELRGAKQFYARLTEAADAALPAGGYVVSRVWWFDQITAALYPHHTMLSVDDAQEERAALGAIQAAGTTSVSVVLSDEEGERRDAPATDGTCFAVADETRIPERSVRLLTLRCATPAHRVGLVY
jgi:hypothetical protein